MTVGARAFEPEDLDFLQHLARHPNVRARTALPAPGDAPAWGAYLSARLSQEARLFVITEAGRAAGFLVISASPTAQARRIGYAVDPARHGCGVASAALAAAVPALFAAPGCRRVEALVEADNAASLRVLEKTGFRRVAQPPLRQHLGERMAALHLYAISKDEA